MFYVGGHKVYLDKLEPNVWRYSDTNAFVKDEWKFRKCPRCNEPPTKDGHDACIALLVAVMA
jgi:hypothetical protein